jgi:hypothetical protein
MTAARWLDAILVADTAEYSVVVDSSRSADR